ncbi:MAG: aspartate-semialdehyde dehydrogenase, partial [Candidatus Aminicenantales bacterium]
SAGRKYRDAVVWSVGGNIPEFAKDSIILDTSVELFMKREVKIVFSAIPSSIAKNIEVTLAKEGIYVFSNASAHRMDADVPILIPEVNPEHFDLVKTQSYKNQGFIVTNSNCSTAGLVMALKPLLNFGLKSVIVTTYQAISGAGRHGVSGLDILGNIIPYIKEEEDKIEKETKKILGKIGKEGLKEANLEVNTSCCRVSTREGHLESIVAELDEDVDPNTIGRALSSFRGVPQEMRLPTAPKVPVVVRTEENRPQPLLDKDAGTPERAKGMAVTVGRIRKKGKRINFFLLVNNLIRGAAGTCILDAEFGVEKNLIR